MPTPIELLWGRQQKKYSYYRGDSLTFERYREEIKAFNKQQLASYLTVGGNTGFYLLVNDEELFKQIEQMTSARAVYQATIRAAEAQFIPRCIPVLKDILSKAASSQEEGAFAKRYINPMLRAVEYLPPPEISGNSPKNVVVTLPDLYDHLGNTEHYAAAFHHGALLADNKSKGGSIFASNRANIRKRVYTESDLRTQNTQSRYKYWKALLEGKSSVKYQIGKDLEPVEFNIEGSWTDTVQARLDAWARAKPSGAPQWILLEYGQRRWKPTIKVETPYGVITNIRSGKNRRATATFRGNQYSGRADISVKQDSISSVLSVIPGNISGAWVEVLSQEWTSILATTWAAQIEAFNKTSTHANYDSRANRLRSPITGRFLQKSAAGQVFPTRSSRIIEPYGPKEGPIIPFRNAPISNDEFWDALGVEDILGDL